ncbi:GNAT family N-acetyltransferase [Vagococcus carniphilus]|uniref:GNAT family N-acetyltransferase n=1 Tax=Vagococcus carniphilus TaxID=218144 RepID=UPI00288DE7BB|nr:GNAT family N-acetyltransferase [Vagococcus carniphilus]MDT2814533.1 GNAT family N-acetyltransferase [Vagococcus carniphilus]MDT2864154.1 GNAT family N-acetyltransferase [Vagococcus carniphilus]
MNIKKGTLENLEELVVLFDQYRQFYGQESNEFLAREFLTERIKKEESIIYLAYLDDSPVGFTQLFPSFSSVSMERMWILNDLFVSEKARQKGVANALIEQAITLSKETDGKGILLETGADNVSAQKLYEKTGFEQETAKFYFYSTR